MLRTVEVRPYDDESVEITLPRDITDRLNLKAGDTMFAVETAAGILLTPNPDSHRMLETEVQISGT